MKRILASRIRRWVARGGVVVAVLTCLFMAASARADVIPALSSVTLLTSGPDSGDYLWTYDVIVTQSEEMQANPAAPTPTTGNYLTMYDVADLVSGSESQPAGWTASEQSTGITPNTENPTDDSSVMNITWNYASGPTLVGPDDLGATFSFVSTDGTEVTGSNFYAGQATVTSGLNAGSQDQNDGHITAPLAMVTTHTNGTPLPSGSTIGMVLCGLIGLAIRRFRLSHG